MSELESAVDEIRAAANRLADLDLGDYQGPTGDDTDMRAGIVLARYVRSRLDQQQAEARERELPVDAEWLRPLCVRVSGKEIYWWISQNDFGDLYVIRHSGGFNLKFGDASIAENANRGHVLDAMKLFGVVPPAKEQP